MGRVRQRPLETEGFARSQAALPPPAALQIRTQFVFGIGIRHVLLYLPPKKAVQFSTNILKDSKA